jgi:hypothetical protein
MRGLRRGHSSLMHGTLPVSCPANGWTIHWTLRGLPRELPTGCQPRHLVSAKTNCVVICFADFSGNFPDTSGQLRQLLCGQSPVLREMFPDN